MADGIEWSGGVRAEQFAYWLQGFSELTGDNPPTPEQWQSIKEHLQTVFVKVTPPLTPQPRYFEPLLPRTGDKPYWPSYTVECSSASSVC